MKTTRIKRSQLTKLIKEEVRKRMLVEADRSTWFDSLSKEQQKAYLDEHPHSAHLKKAMDHLKSFSGSKGADKSSEQETYYNLGKQKEITGKLKGSTNAIDAMKHFNKHGFKLALPRDFYKTPEHPHPGKGNSVYFKHQDGSAIEYNPVTGVYTGKHPSHPSAPKGKPYMHKILNKKFDSHYNTPEKQSKREAEASKQTQEWEDDIKRYNQRYKTKGIK